MRRRERPLSAVPGWVWFVLTAAFAVQLAWRAAPSESAATIHQLPPAPRPLALRLASFGETAAAARLAMLYVQSFDLHAGNDIPLRELNYARLIAWLRSIVATDPRSQYALFAAARVYAEVPVDAKKRQILRFIYQEFLQDPNRRWRWLADAAMIAKYRLHDMPLALRYASALERDTTAQDVPGWARQMVVFILEDMNELQAAKILLGGLLATGHIRDPAQRRFLERRLRQLEKRIDAKSGPEESQGTR